MPYFKRHHQKLLLGFAALLGVDFLQLWIPRFIKRSVDALETGTATSDLLLLYAGAILLIALGIALCRFIWRIHLLGFSRLLEQELRDSLFSHLLSMDRAFYQRRPPGEIMALATNDFAAIQLACGMGLVACVDGLVMTVAALCFMAYINPLLTLIAVLPMPLLAILTRLLSARLHTRFKKVQEKFATITEFARSTISSIRLYKAYNQEKSQTSRFGALGRSYVRDNLRLALIQGTLFPVSGMVANVSLLLVLFWGGGMTINNTISTGDFAAFISYLFLLTWPIMAMGWVINLFQRGVTSLNRIDAIMKEQPALVSPTADTAAPQLSGTIAVRNLKFTYPGQQRSALADVSAHFNPGVCGIVGKTGSGKSTLCQILARLYPVPDGTVFFDDQDVNTLPLDSIRSAISYVPQEVSLFSDRIRDNIAFGRPDASDAEIEAVARAAAIHDEIAALPDGYQTRVGEKGATLSGGQRQRIALARALLLDRPVLLIDDGLSAVDIETEHAIIRSLKRYFTGRTCIIVSHRLAPLADADRILVLDDGRVAAEGRHEDLLTQSEFYRTIYRHQTYGAPGEA